MEVLKTCRRCGEEKDLELFGRHVRRPDGRASTCKLCRAQHEQAKRYGISIEHYEALQRVQGRVCAVCGGTEPVVGRRLAVDHDHETGHTRGLLCSACNKMLGFARDDPEVLYRAIAYLHFWNVRAPAIARPAEEAGTGIGTDRSDPRGLVVPRRS